MLPAHRRPFADESVVTIMQFVQASGPGARKVVALFELTARGGTSQEAMWAAQASGTAASRFITERLAMTAANRAESFGDHLVELAEYHAGLLRYDKSTSAGRYAVALKLDANGSRWARYECLRFVDGTFEATAKGVHPNLGLAMASGKEGRKAGPGGRKREMWGARVTDEMNTDLEALLGDDTRADLVRRALTLEVWLGSAVGRQLLAGVEETLRVVRMGVGPLRPHEVEQLEQLVKALRGGDDG